MLQGEQGVAVHLVDLADLAVQALGHRAAQLEDLVGQNLLNTAQASTRVRHANAVNHGLGSKVLTWGRRWRPTCGSGSRCRGWWRRESHL